MFDTAIARPERYDAVIVGARCAGAATAMLLARAGLRVLAIDRAEYGSDTLSTHTLMKGAVLSLDRWGLLPAVRAAGTPAVMATTFHYGDEQITVPARTEADALYAPRRTVLDRILVDAARDAGAEIRFGCTMETLTTDGGGRVTGLIYIGPDGQRIAVHARIVVGADGASSRVAEQVSAKTRVRGEAGGATLMCYVPGMAGRGFHWHYRNGLMAGIIPTNDDQACVFVGGRHERFRGAPLAETFQTRLREAAPSLAAAMRRTEPAGRLRFFAGRCGYLRTAQGAGWALVGDAGYFKDPCTAHGITDAFRDAELLARAVIADHPAALAAYETQRDSLSLPLFEITERIARFDWSLGALKRDLIALGKCMQEENEAMSRIVAEPPQAPPRLAAAS